MAPSEITKIEKLVDFLLTKVAEVAEEDDWQEADGWVGKWIIVGEGGFQKAYEIREGKFYPTQERDPSEYKGEVTMSVDTFLDLLDAALHGKGEDCFMSKYKTSAIRYRGDGWIVDSERFRKVLKRLGNVGMRGLLKK